MAAKRRTLWFGYLEAGTKGSPVVRDQSIDTGTPATIYLFNLEKGRILEYRREIAEPKLRELTEGESKELAKMRAAYHKARKDFTPRLIVRPPRRAATPEPEPEIPDFEADDDLPAPVDDSDEPEERADAS
jgi:hypothetical protein